MYVCYVRELRLCVSQLCGMQDIGLNEDEARSSTFTDDVAWYPSPPASGTTAPGTPVNLSIATNSTLPPRASDVTPPSIEAPARSGADDASGLEVNWEAVGTIAGITALCIPCVVACWGCCCIYPVHRQRSTE